jgi:hypothetical protein
MLQLSMTTKISHGSQNTKVIDALFENYFEARCQRLTLVILATQEAEIRRITVQSQPRQIVLKTVSRKYLTQKKRGLVEWCRP